MLDDDQQERFTRLWTEVQPSVSGYVHAIVRDPAVAKDLVQETALALLRKFPEFDAQREFLPWALGWRSLPSWAIGVTWGDAG